jgi:large subunit ribosomal protein L19
MKAATVTKETIKQLGIQTRSFPKFRVGDTIAVSQIVKEGAKERIQVFQGDVIAMRGSGASETFTVRRISANNIPAERIYPYHTPIIDSIKVIKRGDVRRAKLYYVRDRIGKRARIKEKVLTKEQKLHLNDQQVATAPAKAAADSEPKAAE